MQLTNNIDILIINMNCVMHGHLTNAFESIEIKMKSRKRSKKTETNFYFYFAMDIVNHKI